MVRTSEADDPVLTMTDQTPPDENEPGPEQPTTEPATPEQPTSEQPGPERPTTEQPTAAAQPARRLYRTRDERVMAGVCGGIARYFNIDPVLVRVGAVALAFLGGAGLLAYLAAVLLIPKEGEGGRPPEAPSRGLVITGAVLLVVAFCVVLPFRGGWGRAGDSCRSGSSPLRASSSGGWLPVRGLKGTHARSCAPWRSASPSSRSASSSPSAPRGRRPRAATASSRASSSPPASR